MSQVLERERVEYRVSVRRRSPLIDYTLIIVGALVAAVGVYFQFAPADWWLAHFAQGYHFGSYMLGSALLATGFGVYARRTSEEDGYRSDRATAATTLAVLAALGVLVVAVVALWVL